MTTKSSNQIGPHAAWHLLSVLPAGSAVDVCAHMLLDHFSGRHLSWQPGLAPVAVSPDVVRYAYYRAGPHVRPLEPIWAAFTLPESATLALDLSMDMRDRVSAAMNPATGISDEQLLRLADDARGARLDHGRWLYERLHYSKVSPGRFEVARRACEALEDSRYTLLVTEGMYPYEQGPIDLDALTPAMATSWSIATPPIYREGLDEVLDLCRRGMASGGRMHVNPWLEAALLKRDFYDWDLLLGNEGLKPVAGRLLGEELRRRVGDDPGLWSTALGMLLDWDGTLVEWLETASALR